ncbi:SDR family oxidoreductase [Chitinophaga solisilvae]|uniref:SDR family oxidoreductase n=1 Tax=Chitinophaga solisilvae TaxID=1233460 RepID=UPI001370546F|nr:SDR family oxidoreductase [Chitinophaga solisilvae]
MTTASNNSNSSILITGATGNIGSILAGRLAAQGVPFRALVRSSDNAEKIAGLPGAELVTGDLADKASVLAALQGITHAFLLTNSSAQAEELQLNFVAAAKEAGVQHIVKLSQLAADKQSPVRFLRYHAAVEEAIINSGIAYTFLRPNLFMQGFLSFRDMILNKNMFIAAIGNAPVSVIDIRDIADVALAALTQPGHENKTYTLTGPAALTHAQIADILSASTGKRIKFVDITPEEMQQAVLSVGFPSWQAAGLIEDYAHYARHEAAFITGTVAAITGTPARNFEDFAQEYFTI